MVYFDWCSIYPGYGSKYGRGYLLDIYIRTLSFVKKEQKTKIEEEAIAYLEKYCQLIFLQEI